MAKNNNLESRLSKFLKKLIFDKGTNVAKLSKEIDIPQPTLNRIVLGKTKNPHPKSLEKMAEYFGIPVKEITQYTDEDSPLIENEIIKIPQFEITDIKNSDFVESLTSINFINIDAPLGNGCFAVNLNNSSMEPMFIEGTTLIFNPEKAPRDKSFVLTFLHDTSTPVFRQILLDSDFRYLKPTNPSLSSLPVTVLKPEDKILGTLVESRRNYDLF
jgi:transcriptional regulator with XRE-family HTH domain